MDDERYRSRPKSASSEPRRRRSFFEKGPLHLLAVFRVDVPLGTRTAAYRKRLRTRPAFVRAAAIK
jgi:hypothetical protein